MSTLGKMATKLEKYDDALRAAPIVAGRHIRRQKYNKQSREAFRDLRTVLRDARAVRKMSAQVAGILGNSNSKH